MIFREFCLFAVITSIVMKVKPYSISNPSVKRILKCRLDVGQRQERGFSTDSGTDSGSAEVIHVLNTEVTRKSIRIKTQQTNLSDNIEVKCKLNEYSKQQSKLTTFTSKKNEKLSIATITSVNESKSSSFWDTNEIIQESKVFSSSSTWTDWLSEHHSTATHIWIKIAKLHSNIPSVSRKDALQVALCYGWIDGVCKSLNDVYFLQRYTPRRKNSNWSLVNKNFTAELIAKGLMRESGFKAIEAAKADGRWNKNNK